MNKMLCCSVSELNFQTYQPNTNGIKNWQVRRKIIKNTNMADNEHVFKFATNFSKLNQGKISVDLYSKN